MDLLFFLGDLFWGLVGLFRKSTTPRATGYQVAGVALLTGCVGACAAAVFGPEGWQAALLVVGALLVAAAMFCGYMRLEGAASGTRKGAS